jgi:predicted MFS family arabinose efflux permease
VLSVVSRGASIASAKAAGFLLNADPRWLRVVFPVAGVLCFAENTVLSLIRWRRGGRTRTVGAGFREAWKRSARLLRDDAAFRRYEIAWSLYGVGFLMSTPMIVVFGESDLQVSYNEWTWAQGVAMPIAGILGTVPAGRLVDRLGPVRTTAVSYFLLTVFFALIPFAATATHLVAAFFVWGLAMAGVGIVWNLGPLSFAPEGEGRRYAAAHVALVGLRSVVGPPLGYLIAETVSLRATFVVSAVMVAAAGAICWRVRAPGH